MIRITDFFSIICGGNTAQCNLCRKTLRQKKRDAIISLLPVMVVGVFAACHAGVVIGVSCQVEK